MVESTGQFLSWGVLIRVYSVPFLPCVSSYFAHYPIPPLMEHCPDDSDDRPIFITRSAAE